MKMLDRLDRFATDDPGFREGHYTDRCPLCDWPVRDHPGFGVEGEDGARWPHRRAALLDIIGAAIDRFFARWGA